MALILRIIATALAISVAQAVSGAIAFSIFGSEAFPAMAAGAIPWQIGANVLVASALAWIALRSSLAGWKLATLLALIYFGIMHWNSLIEALFFGFLTARQFGTLLFMTVLLAVLLIAALRVLLALPPSTAHRTWVPRLTPGRLAAGAFAYLVIYFVAGMSVYPFISHFYEQQQMMPSGLQVVSMQLFVRGPIFVALAAIIVVMTRATRREMLLMVATAMSVIGGIAPLMVPNAFFPDSIRWAHFAEVTASNFVFGLFLGWILSAATPDAVHTPAATTAPDRQDRTAYRSVAPES